MLLALAALTGGLGAAARFIADGEIRLRWAGALPVSTLVINVVGSLILGVTVGLAGEVTSAAAAEHDPSLVRGILAFATVGFCGGFTTFSTAMFEVTQLYYKRRPWMAAGYVVGSAVLAIIAVVAGLAITLR